MLKNSQAVICFLLHWNRHVDGRYCKVVHKHLNTMTFVFLYFMCVNTICSWCLHYIVEHFEYDSEQRKTLPENDAGTSKYSNLKIKTLHKNYI